MASIENRAKRGKLSVLKSHKTLRKILNAETLTFNREPALAYA